MFRKLVTQGGAPLLKSYQSQRGMASLKDMGVNSVKSLRDIAQSQKTKTAIRFAMVELSPPTPAEIPRAIRDGVRLFRHSNWRNVTVREAWLNTLVTIEVVCWFFVGECIGKGTFVGYQV